MKNILLFILLIIVFIGAPLTFHYFIPSSIIAGLLTFILLIYFAIHRYTIDVFEGSWFITWLIYAFGVLVLATVHLFYGVNEFRMSLGVLVKLVFILTALIVTRLYLFSIVKLLNSISVIQLLLAVVGLLVVFTNIIEINPIEIDLDSGRKYYHFFITGASNTIIRYHDNILIRPTGYFEEPGAMALFLTWILVLNEFTYKKRGLVIFIVILGMALRSLAFLVSLIAYFSVVLIIKKQFKIIITTILSVILLIVVLRAIDSPHIDLAIDSLIQRISIEGGRLGGDNRDMFKMLDYVNFKNVFFGIGNKNVRELHFHHGAPTGASATGFLLKNGIIGYVFLYIPFLYVLYLYRKDKRILFFVVIAINFLQRTGIDELYIMLIMTILVQLKNPKIKKELDVVFVNND